MKTLKEALNDAGNASDHLFVDDGSWAKAFLASLESNGYCIVPMEATDKMRSAAFYREDRSGDRFKSVFRAMLAARPKIED